MKLFGSRTHVPASGRVERIRQRGSLISAVVTVVVVLAILLVEFAGLPGGLIQGAVLLSLVAAIGVVAYW